METGTISEKIKRGKHTTRHCGAVLCGGGYVPDGYAGLFLPCIWKRFEPQNLKDYFPEFEAFEPACRFAADCVHIGEPVCGVKEALAEGKISQSRYDNYGLLYQELKNRRKY